MIELAIVGPDEVAAGSSLDLVVELATDELLAVVHAELQVRGIEGWRARGFGRGATQYFVDETIELAGAGSLIPGTHAWTATIAIPSTSPPTHDTTPAFAELSATVRLSRNVPSPGDDGVVIRSHRIAVRVVTPGPLVRTPVVQRLRTGELELGVATSRLAIGETITGWLTTGPPRVAPVAVTLQLVAVTETLPGGALVEWGWRTLVVALPAGELAMPFDFALPEAMPPTFQCHTHARRWVLVARLPSRLGARGARVDIPLEIADVEGSPGPRSSVAPEVGAHPLRPELEAFAAAHGWHVAETVEIAGDFGLIRPVVTRAAGTGTTFELGYAFAADGPHAFARSRYPGLGLGLEVESSTPLREALTRDLEADHAAWDRTHHVDARFAAQTEPFLRAVVPVLVAATSLGTLARWTDDEIVFTQPTAWLARADLERLATELAVVSGAIAKAAGELVTPPGLVLDLEAWRALAAELEGSLALGDVSITGTFEGFAVRVGVAWDGERTRGIQATVRPPSGAMHYVELQLAHPIAAPADTALAPYFARWPSDVRELTIADGVATAARPLASSAAGARELVELLVRVFGELVRDTDPYR